MMGNEIENKILWWNGPSWLAQDEDKWLQREFSCLKDCPEGKKKIQIIATKVDSDQNLKLTGFLVF